MSSNNRKTKLVMVDDKDDRGFLRKQDERIWEKVQKMLGLWKGQVSTHQLRTLCDQDPRDHFQSMADLRAILMAFTKNKIPARAFFGENGEPLAFRDICNASDEKLREIRIQSKGQMNEIFVFFSALFKYWFLFGIADDLVYTTGRINKMYKAPSHNNFRSVLSSTFTAASEAFLLALIMEADVISNGKLRKRLNEFIDIHAREVDSHLRHRDAATADFPKKLDADIRAACQGTSIVDFRKTLLEKHPNIPAHFLVHPNGRLFNDREICIMLADF